MKDLLRRFALWFMSGFALILGGAIAAVLISLAREAWAPNPYAQAEDNKGQVVVASLEPLTVTRSAGVVAQLKNSTDKRLRVASAELVLKQGEKALFWCSVYASRPIEPGRTNGEQLLCNEVERSLLPAGVAYELNVKRVEVWK